jgi:hypothetical protein
MSGEIRLFRSSLNTQILENACGSKNAIKSRIVKQAAVLKEVDKCLKWVWQATDREQGGGREKGKRKPKENHISPNSKTHAVFDMV